ncbi:hypothetical protein LRS10_02530 [Phenylobacterium sp. J426]|jgi:uncharacterized membrane protein|uniref:DUF2231 domain-containing protein n=2 Tax=unclassified Phenylobacterium TaxID=2640670 RepID=UPI002150D63E|nr:DUF2231 domain-containing protein [Phenylobacterium sp. J426]MCR5873172.1 hypothetical protein [Phenylobacterium sp. J426]
MTTRSPLRVLGAGLLGAALIWAGPSAAHEGHAPKPGPSPTAAAVGPHGGMEVATPEGQMSADGRPPADDAAPTTFGGRLVNWLGRWHPSVVHFPIALFIVVAVLEARALLLRRERVEEATRLMIALSALSALAAIVLGWMAMGWTYGRYDRLHTAHQTLGTSIAPLALGVWWAHERWLSARRPGAGVVYAVLLAATVAAIGINGFIGGALVRGLDHLNF